MGPPRIQAPTHEDRCRKQCRGGARDEAVCGTEESGTARDVADAAQENAALRGMNDQLRTKVKDLEKDSEVQQGAAFAAPEEREHEYPSDNEGEQLCGDQGQKR